MIRFPSGLEPVDDLSPAAWVEEALRNWPRGRQWLVRDLVPPIFEAYARILHLAHRPEDRHHPTGTWTGRASQLGRTVGPETSWYEVTGTSFNDGRAGDAWVPGVGSSSEEEASAFASLLSRYTTTPLTCWFVMWSGWGEISGGSSLLFRVSGPISRLKMRWETRLEGRRTRREAAGFRTFPLFGGGRSYLLFSGAVEDAARFDLGYRFQSPALWWPEDRTWFVHTEIASEHLYRRGRKR